MNINLQFGGFLSFMRDLGLEMMMSKTVYDARSAEAWRLVHDEHEPAKQVASKLKVSLAELYEMLAVRKLRIDQATHRRVALGSHSAIQPTPYYARQA